MLGDVNGSDCLAVTPNGSENNRFSQFFSNNHQVCRVMVFKITGFSNFLSFMNQFFAMHH